MQRKVLVALTANGFVVTALCVAAALLARYGQCLDPYLFGHVVEIPAADQIWRGYIVKRESGREVEVGCFRFQGMRKLHAARPFKYAFEVEAKLSEKIPVSSDVAGPDHQRSSDEILTHPPGALWNRSYCFEMPGTVSDTQAIVVTGHAEHIRLILGRPFPFWTSITPTPPFAILPTHCYGRDGTVGSGPGFEDCRTPVRASLP